MERVRLSDAGELETMLTERRCHVIHRAGACDGGPLGSNAPRVLLADQVP